MSAWKKVLIVLAALFFGLIILGSVFGQSGSQTSNRQLQQAYPENAPKPSPAPKSNSEGYYINVDGNKIQSPVQAPSAPAGATAKCRDGSYSFSQHHRGTCSHHGGVAEWL